MDQFFNSHSKDNKDLKEDGNNWTGHKSMDEASSNQDQDQDETTESEIGSRTSGHSNFTRIG